MAELDSSRWQRWAALAHKPRKDVPRVYESLDDARLADLLKQANHTLSIIERLDQKCFDAQPEAQQIRAMSAKSRDELRHETQAKATRVRDEFRRRMAWSVSES